MMSVLAKRFDDSQVWKERAVVSRIGKASATATSGATSSTSRPWLRVIMWLLASGSVSGIFTSAPEKREVFAN